MRQSHSRRDRSGRRQFLVKCSAVAASGLVLPGLAKSAAAASAGMPTIALGRYRVSRLIAGANPLAGYSYQGPEMDREMKAYFTPEHTRAFLQQCEAEGINTHQFSPASEADEVYRKLRDQGSKLQWICLHSKREDIPKIAEATQPIAMVHHGGATDKRFREGHSSQVHDFVKAVHDRGLLAGVSAHNPDCIQRVADEGWEVDFFMTCFHYLTRDKLDPAHAPPVLPGPTVHYTFYDTDRIAMCKVIRQVKQPCLAFKILGGGRRCASQEVVRAAFQFAYTQIKPSDAVIVGMYPRRFDQVRSNAQYARELGVVT